MTRAKPYVLGPEEQVADLGGLAMKAGHTETGDGATVWEGELPPRTAGPPLHVHGREDEMTYVVSGELTIRLGDELVTAGAGSFVWMPRGVPHTFANRSAAPTRLLGMTVPGHEAFEELLAAAPRGGTRPDVETLTRLAEVAGSRLLGPPLSVETEGNTTSAVPA